jgi:hypothetical protein
MMATPLVESTVYSYKATARVFWSTDITDIENVTRTELDDATDLSCELGDILGWEIQADKIDAASWGVFAAQRIGKVVVPQSQLLLRADLDGVDIRTVLSRGVSGWVLILPTGDVEARPMNVLPVTVNFMSQSVRMRGVAYVLADFAVTSRPAENVAIPA